MVLCLASKALSALCSGLYSQGCSYSESWKTEALSSVYYCLPLKQRASMLTAHYVIFEIHKIRVFSSNKIHYMSSGGPLCSVLCEVQLGIQTQMNADTLATAKAIKNKLYFISDSASNHDSPYFHQHPWNCDRLIC